MQDEGRVCNAGSRKTIRKEGESRLHARVIAEPDFKTGFLPRCVEQTIVASKTPDRCGFLHHSNSIPTLNEALGAERYPTLRSTEYKGTYAHFPL